MMQPEGDRPNFAIADSNPVSPELGALDLPGAEPGSLGDRCWKTVGIWGDHSCPELATHIHCRNCPRYTQTGRSLLDRPAPPDYIESLAAQFSQIQALDRQAQQQAAMLNLVIFRLGAEWWAIAAQFIRETALTSPIHSLPHRSNEILKGIINVRGELMLYVALSGLLSVATGDREAAREILVAEANGSTWVFGVDELLGLQQVSTQALKPPPATLSQTKTACTQAIFTWQGKSVNLLEGELLFYRIERRALQLGSDEGVKTREPKGGEN
jgi:chemotaxis-related protein WspD